MGCLQPVQKFLLKQAMELEVAKTMSEQNVGTSEEFQAVDHEVELALKESKSWTDAIDVDVMPKIIELQAKFGKVQAHNVLMQDQRKTLSVLEKEMLEETIEMEEDVGKWLDEISLGGYKDVFALNKVTGEYLDNLSNFTTEEILRFIRRCHMKWGDFITLCKELRRVKVACLRGDQEVRRPWWAPACFSVVYAKAARQNRHSRVVSLKFDP
ncbi:hypothetical protein L7F22_029605 [Adiantum nelumboides]|nr:hypothetical protein [Adiantum nelumboides]